MDIRENKVLSPLGCIEIIPNDVFLDIVVPLPCKATIALSLTCKSVYLRMDNEFWCRKIQWRTGKYTRYSNAKQEYRKYIYSGTPNIPMLHRDITKIDSCKNATVLVKVSGECLLYVGEKKKVLSCAADDALVHMKKQLIIVAILSRGIIEWLFMDGSDLAHLESKFIQEHGAIVELVTLGETGKGPYQGMLYIRSITTCTMLRTGYKMDL